MECFQRIGGIHDEFITGARLDNLVGTYAVFQGLLESLIDDRLLADDSNIRIAAAYDNEEVECLLCVQASARYRVVFKVGSQTAQGAQSAFTEYVLRRLASGGEPCAFEEAIGRSILISADQAHAVHPNYGESYEARTLNWHRSPQTVRGERCGELHDSMRTRFQANHRPYFHSGVVVKINLNQRYATTSTTHSVLKQIAAEANVPLQVRLSRSRISALCS